MTRQLAAVISCRPAFLPFLSQLEKKGVLNFFPSKPDNLSSYSLSVARGDIAGDGLDRAAVGIAPVVAFFFSQRQRVSVLVLSVDLL